MPVGPRSDSRRFIALLALLAPLGLALGCEKEPTLAGFFLQYSPPSLRDEAAAVEITYLRGGCAGAPDGASVQATIGGVPRARELPAGPWGISVHVRDDACEWIGAGCADIDVPLGQYEVVDVDIVQEVPTPGCAPGFVCATGLCLSPDGAIRIDAGAGDASLAEDSGTSDRDGA